jgi:lipoprotein NlpI
VDSRFCPNEYEILGDAEFPDEAKHLYLENGEALVQFVISADGQVTGVATKASHKVFADYATSIVNRLECVGIGRDVHVLMPFGFKNELGVSDIAEPIPLQPQSAAAFAGRGRWWALRKNFDKAIADYDVAIRLNPSVALPFADRGVALANLGKFDRAISDYDQAIVLDPKFGEAYLRRGVAWAATRDYEKAIADYDQAIRLRPDDSTAAEQLALGRFRFYEGQFARSAEDLRRAVDQAPKYAYAPLWLYLARTRSGQREKAVAELEANRQQLDSSPWPLPLIEFYLGRIERNAVFAAASSPDTKERNERLCEANLFVAEWQLLAGDEAGARPLLDAAVRSCPRTFVEYNAAIAELKRLH